MKFFVRWLVDNGRKVRLLIGETNGSDESVVREIMADMRACGPVSTRRRSSPSRCRPSPT